MIMMITGMISLRLNGIGFSHIPLADLRVRVAPSG